MLNSLRRIYLYAVASVALIFTTFALQNVLFALLIRTEPAEFSGFYGSGSDLSRALAFLVIDLLIIVPLGGLHYWFIRRDARQDPKALGGVVRQLFLDVLTIQVGQVTIISALFVGADLFGNVYARQSFISPLATLLAWGVTLAAVILERQRTRDQLPVARGISLSLGYLTQLGLLIAVVSYGAYAVQQFLDRVITAAPTCNYFAYPYDYNSSAQCQIAPTMEIGSLVGILVPLMLGLAGFMVWTRTDQGSIFRQLGDIAFLLTGAITAIIGIERLAYLILSFATNQAQVGWPLALVDNNQQNYTFAGALVAGALALAFYLARTWRIPAQGKHPQQGKQLAIIALAVPLAFTFLAGLITLVAGVFQTLHGDVVTAQQWNSGASLAIAGGAWIALWPYLARMSDPRGAGPAVPRRVYVFILLGASLLGGAISLVTGLYYVVTSLIGAPLYGSASIAEDALAGALVLSVTAGYYVFVLRRDQRVLQERANVTITPGMVSAAAQMADATAPDPLEEFLEEVAAGRLPVPVAARQLRDRFGAI